MRNKIALSILILLSAIGFSCSRMEGLHEDFIKDGPIKYTGRIKSAKVYPGKNRVVIQGLKTIDPDAKNIKVKWEFEGLADSVVRTLVAVEDGAYIKIELNSLREGEYTFYITTSDDSGNTSVPVEVSGSVYGEQYISFLRQFPATAVSYNSNKLVMGWDAITDTTVQRIEVLYTNLSGVEKELRFGIEQLKKGISNINIADFKVAGVLKYRTVFLPNSLALDTIYGTYKSIPYQMEMSKIGWIATASSYDTRAGASNRPPSNAIDNNNSTIWHNFVGTPAVVYPHTITIDLGILVNEIQGSTLTMRAPVNGALKDVEFLVSEENLVWESLGNFSLVNTASQQFVNFPRIVNCRYFRMIAKSDFNNSNNIALAEIGLFKQFNK